MQWTLAHSHSVWNGGGPYYSHSTKWKCRITNYLPFTECKFGLKAHMEHPNNIKSYNGRSCTHIRYGMEGGNYYSHWNTTIPTDIITTARVHLKTARVGDAIKHSNQDYPKIASNVDNTKSYADGWTIFIHIINYGVLTHAKNTEYNYMQAGKTT